MGRDAVKNIPPLPGDVLKYSFNLIIIRKENINGKVSAMRKAVNRIIMCLGCVCIIIAATLFVYNKHLSEKNYTNAHNIYKKAEALIPPVYISSTSGDLSIYGYLVRATVSSAHLQCVVAKDHDLPYYHKKMIALPDYLKGDLQKVSIGETITLHKVNGKKITYKVTDSGRIPYKNLTPVGLTIYCQTNGYCYFISSKRI